MTTAYNFEQGNFISNGETQTEVNSKVEEPPGTCAVSETATMAFRRTHYPSIDDKTWGSWKWQVKNRIKKYSDLEQLIPLTELEKAALEKTEFSITPYYLSLINAQDINDPLRKCVIPVPEEFIRTENESEDPLHEENDLKVPCLVHRYPDRVLFLTTPFCSTFCRYCTRSRLVDCSKYNFDKKINYKKYWNDALEYIRNNTNIRDVLLSGGDPLTIPTLTLEYLLIELKKIHHVEMVRIGTKVPVVMPQRITPNLIKMLKQFHPLYLSIHFTHPNELTAECQDACTKLANAGIPLGSQTVLLKGVNDNAETMKRLFQGLLKIRVRPYYMYQCDPIIGSSHFRTPVEKGKEIIFALRGNTTGYAIPTYVIDAPGGGGKIPITPDYVVDNNEKEITLRNYNNEIFKYRS